MDYKMKLANLKSNQSEFQAMKSKVNNIVNEYTNSSINKTADLGNLANGINELMSRLNSSYQNCDVWFSNYLIELETLESSIATFNIEGVTQPVDFNGKFEDIFGKKTIASMRTDGDTNANLDLGEIKTTNTAEDYNIDNSTIGTTIGVEAATVVSVPTEETTQQVTQPTTQQASSSSSSSSSSGGTTKTVVVKKVIKVIVPAGSKVIIKKKSKTSNVTTNEVATTTQASTVPVSEGVQGAIDWALATAADNSHGYSQSTRWGNPNYDCSSFVISAYQAAGIPVKTNGATYTGNMKNAFLKSGFIWIPGNPNVNDLQPGDVLLDENVHTEMYIGNGKNVGAHSNYDGRNGDSSGREVSVGNYYSHPWDGVLRYVGN